MSLYFFEGDGFIKRTDTKRNRTSGRKHKADVSNNNGRRFIDEY